MNDTYNPRDPSLEPRVAKLEVGLERLTEDVRSLASVVRDQGATVEKQLSELTVAVTQAAGPRKTDWSVIISAVLLIMAIGSAAFWPLNQTVQENKVAIETLNQSFQNHGQLMLHPVGQALVQRLELQLKDHVDLNRREMESHLTDAREMHSMIGQNVTKQLEYVQRIHDLELKGLKEKVDLHNDRIYGRVVKLEDQERMEAERDRDELQAWRMKAMGLEIPSTATSHTHGVLTQDPGQK
jgi:hypothetical protein